MDTVFEHVYDNSDLGEIYSRKDDVSNVYGDSKYNTTKP